MDRMRGLGYYLRGKFFIYLFISLFINFFFLISIIQKIYIINNSDSLDKLNKLGFILN
jgi:hypothetical protein